MPKLKCQKVSKFFYSHYFYNFFFLVDNFHKKKPRFSLSLYPILAAGTNRRSPPHILLLPQRHYLFELNYYHYNKGKDFLMRRKNYNWIHLFLLQ